MMTALRPYTLLSFSLPLTHTHTHTHIHTHAHTHSPCLPISCSLCLVSLPRLPLPLSHAHTDNGILYIVSLTQRRKHTHLHERSGKHTHTDIHTHTPIHAYSHTSLHDKYFTKTHMMYTHFFSCIVCLSLRHTLSLFLTRTHTQSHTHKHTHTHKRCTTLSVLEFYILMKEEARRPIRAAGAGRDHLSADSRVVRRQFDGALSGSSLSALPMASPCLRAAGGTVRQAR